MTISSQTIKRQELARRARVEVRNFLSALFALNDMLDERAQAGNFVDADFSSTGDMLHIDAGMIGVLFDAVVPSLMTNYVDAGNGNRNRQILNQIK